MRGRSPLFARIVIGCCCVPTTVTREALLILYVPPPSTSSSPGRSAAIAVRRLPDGVISIAYAFVPQRAAASRPPCSHDRREANDIGWLIRWLGPERARNIADFARP